MKVTYRGATDKILFTVLSKSGVPVDLTGKAVHVVYCYAGTLKQLSAGFSTGSKYSGTVTLEDAAAGECSVQLAVRDTYTKTLGILDMHVMVDASGAETSYMKYVEENYLQIKEHFIS
ncbi:MAG: hypothetical protein ACRBFS_22895 [Aureispira sp.]